MYVSMYLYVCVPVVCQKERGGLARSPQVPKYDKTCKEKNRMYGWMVWVQVLLVYNLLL